MRTRRVRTSLPVLGAVCLTLVAVGASGVESTDSQTWATSIVVASDKEVLKGLQGVRVVVQGYEFSTDAKELGLTKENVQTQVELRLRSLGIKVLSESEAFAAGLPVLFVSVGFEKGSVPGLRLFSVGVALQETVRLVRDNRVVFGAKTWDRGMFGSTVESGARDHVPKSVLELVDMFANDYLAVNPKK